MMFPRLFFPSTLFIVLAMSAFSSAQDHPQIDSIQSVIAPFIEQGDLAGSVTMVVSHNQVLHASAQGLASRETSKSMQLDSIFWIASMTKPVTAVAVMILEQEGKLQLSDPISKHLPELAGLKLEDGTPVTITIQQLLSHTSGMEDLPPEQAYRPETLKEVTELYAQGRVLFPPGSQWRYCQSSINTAARIVEVLSGQTFDQFLQERVFQPLGMVDTGFYLSEKQAERLATSYKKDGDKLVPVSVRLLYDKPATFRGHFPAGNGGLFSTALDYSRFCQMLLGKGEREDVRVLKPESVVKLATVVTGDLKTGFTPGNAWGVGVCIVRKPQGVSAALAPGSFGHGGAYGTQAWVDPTNDLGYILMIQRSDLPNSDDSSIRKAFQDTAFKSLRGSTSK